MFWLAALELNLQQGRAKVPFFPGAPEVAEPPGSELLELMG